MTGQTLPEAAGDAQEGPFDFRSPAQDGRPPGYGQPAPNQFTAEEMERGQKCGKAILERAMLGPPLHESGSVCGSTGMATQDFTYSTVLFGVHEHLPLGKQLDWG
jgi:hypothetical protein